MSRFSPTVSRGTYNRPNYLANALQDVAGTALDLMGERRRSQRDIANREDEQAFRQAEMDRDFAYRQGRDTIADQRYDETVARNAAERELDLAERGIVKRNPSVDFAPIGQYTDLGSTGYAQLSSRTPEGQREIADAQRRAQVAALADSLRRLNPGAADAMTGVTDPDLVGGLVGQMARDRYVTDPAEVRGNTRALDLYRGKARIDQQFAGQGGTRITLADGTVGIVTPQGIQRLGMVGGGEQPTKPLPQSAGGRVPTKDMMDNYAGLLTDIGKIDELIGADGAAGLFATPEAQKAVGLQNFIPGLFGAKLGGKLMNARDPQGTDVRAALAELTSSIRNKRAGAALTQLEYQTLEPFLAEATDSPEAARTKLSRLRKTMNDLLTNKNKVYQASGYRSMNSPDPEDEEIEAIRRAMGGGNE